MFVLRFLLPRYIIYYENQSPQPPLRSLILSHKSRQPNPTSRPSFSRCALSSASLLFPRSIPQPFSFAMPFTPSAEYRSTHRNVVLVFTRVPFYPSAWRLIRVSSSLHFSPFAILFSIPLYSSLSLVLAHIYLPFMFSRLFRFLMYVQRVMFRTLSAEV